MRDPFGNMCDGVGQDARARGMMMRRDSHRGLISEKGDNETDRTQGTKDHRSKNARTSRE